MDIEQQARVRNRSSADSIDLVLDDVDAGDKRYGRSVGQRFAVEKA